VRFDTFEKVLVALFALALLVSFREQILYEPIAVRVLVGEAQREVDLQQTRSRLAAEDTARYIDEHMFTLQQSPDKFALLKTSIKAARTNGLYCEFGVWTGGTVNFIASLVPDKKVHGFDSFEGLPESWRDGFGRGTFAINGLPPVRSNVILHKGWFDRTVPEFHASTTEPIAFVHIDSDLYSSAKTVLEGMADRIVPGTVIQFDEFFGYPGWKSNGEYKAFTEFVGARPVRWKFIGYSKEQAAVLIE